MGRTVETNSRRDVQESPEEANGGLRLLNLSPTGENIIEKYVEATHPNGKIVSGRVQPWEPEGAGRLDPDEVNNRILSLANTYYDKEASVLPSLREILAQRARIRGARSRLKGEHSEAISNGRNTPELEEGVEVYEEGLAVVEKDLGLTALKTYVEERFNASRARIWIDRMQAGVSENAEPGKEKRKNDDGEGVSWRPSARVASYASTSLLATAFVLAGGEANAQEVDTAHRGEGETGEQITLADWSINLDAVLDGSEEERQNRLGQTSSVYAVNARAGMSTNSEVLTTLPQETEVFVVSSMTNEAGELWHLAVPLDESGSPVIDENGNMLEVYLHDSVVSVSEDLGSIYSELEAVGVTADQFEVTPDTNYADMINGGLYYLGNELGVDLNDVDIVSQNPNGIVFKDSEVNVYFIGDISDGEGGFMPGIRIFSQDKLREVPGVGEDKVVDVVFPEREQTALANLVLPGKDGEDGKLLGVLINNGREHESIEDYFEQYFLDLRSLNLPDDARAIIDTGNENALVINGVIVGYVQQGGELELIDRLETSEVRDFVEENENKEAEVLMEIQRGAEELGYPNVNIMKIGPSAEVRKIFPDSKGDFYIVINEDVIGDDHVLNPNVIRELTLPSGEVLRLTGHDILRLVFEQARARFLYGPGENPGEKMWVQANLDGTSPNEKPVTISRGDVQFDAERPTVFLLTGEKTPDDYSFREKVGIGGTTSVIEEIDNIQYLLMYKVKESDTEFISKENPHEEDALYLINNEIMNGMFNFAAMSGYDNSLDIDDVNSLFGYNVVNRKIEDYSSETDYDDWINILDFRYHVFVGIYEKKLNADTLLPIVRK